MGVPFVLPEGVTLETLWEWLKENQATLYWSPRLKVWVAADGFDAKTWCEAYGNSPEEALYFLTRRGVPMPRKDAA
jgi:hypothetical protein